MAPLALPRPSRADRIADKEKRKAARRSSPVPNAAGAALPKPEVWRCAAYTTWAKKRYDCAIKGKAGHVCRREGGKVVLEFAHAEPEGRGLKSSDHHGVVLCAEAHRIQTETSWQSFQSRFDFDRDATARLIFESSPWAKKVVVVW